MKNTRFRAWDKINKYMVEVIGLSWYWKDVEGISGMLIGIGDKQQKITRHGVNDFILMQYTGLKDEKGREICESDIVWWGKDNYASPSRFFLDDGAFWVIEDDVPELLINVAMDIEIIGNIYDNSELLK